MTNRIIYFTGLLITFVFMISAYILIRFAQEDKAEQTQRYISPEVDLLLEFHPAMFFKEALLTPLFSTNLSPEDRLIFETDRALIPSEPTGISFLSPFYLTSRKIDEETLYALYFTLNSVQDFAVYSKKQATLDSPFVYQHVNETGVIAYSASIPTTRIRAILSLDFENTRGRRIPFTNEEKQNADSPLKIHSLKDGKIHESINLLHHVNSNKIDFSGNITLTYPVIINKITPIEDGLYLSLALSNELKAKLYPVIETYISRENWESITGLELNYAGIKINSKTRQPEPKISIHVHHTSDSLFNPLDGLPRNWIRANSQMDSIIIANTMLFASVKSEGLYTLKNMNYRWREEEIASTWEVIGKPSTLFDIDEPFKSMALAFDPKIRGLNRLVQHINWLSSKANSDGNKLTIKHEVEFKSAVNPYFELFYFIRKLGE